MRMRIVLFLHRTIGDHVMLGPALAKAEAIVVAILHLVVAGAKTFCLCHMTWLFGCQNPRVQGKQEFHIARRMRKRGDNKKIGIPAMARKAKRRLDGRIGQAFEALTCRQRHLSWIGLSATGS